MSEEKSTLITRRGIDAMPDDSLLPFARKHSQMLGERFCRCMETYYNPQVQDEPYFLWRLCRLDLEQFTQLTQEQNRREYIAGGQWAAVLLFQGGTLPEDVLAKQEWAMPAALAEATISCPLDSALSLEVSEKARRLWASQTSPVPPPHDPMRPAVQGPGPAGEVVKCVPRQQCAGALQPGVEAPGCDAGLSCR